MPNKIACIQAALWVAICSQAAYSQSCNTATLGNISQDGNTLYSPEYNDRLLYTAVFGSFNGLDIFDANAPTSSDLVGQYSSDESALWVTVAIAIAYLLTTDGLICIDTSDPTLPTAIGNYNTMLIEYRFLLSPVVEDLPSQLHHLAT
ncbi:MAG: hypothetical protein ED559_06345 [Phycisphaera sp.]|nr:MAG: hypothetical protein ED559_06345 [Phycisphaera sp.]